MSGTQEEDAAAAAAAAAAADTSKVVRHVLASGDVPFSQMLEIFAGHLPAMPHHHHHHHSQQQKLLSLHQLCAAWKDGTHTVGDLFVAARVFSERIVHEFKLRFANVVMEGGNPVQPSGKASERNWSVTHVAQQPRDNTQLELVKLDYDAADGTIAVHIVSQATFEPTPEPIVAPTPAPVVKSEAEIKYEQDMIKYHRDCAFVAMQQQQAMSMLLWQQQQQAQQQARQQALQQQALQQQQAPPQQSPSPQLPSSSPAERSRFLWKQQQLKIQQRAAVEAATATATAASSPSPQARAMLLWQQQQQEYMRAQHANAMLLWQQQQQQQAQQSVSRFQS
jgi:hypothetical protein